MHQITKAEENYQSLVSLDIIHQGSGLRTRLGNTEKKMSFFLAKLFVIHISKLFICMTTVAESASHSAGASSRLAYS